MSAPVLSATEEFSARLKRTAGETEDLLEHLLTPGQATAGGAVGDSAGDSAPMAALAPGEARLWEAMRHATLGGGKRLRALLAVEGAALFDVPRAQALRVGAAVECLHAYSLVHDDLPAMDDDDLRRGRPTVHRAYDEATAILAGDALQTLAFEILADPATHADGAVRAGLCLALAQASGAGGMVAGQVIDIAAESAPAPFDLQVIRRLQALKTGALIRFAAEAGAILAGDMAGRAALARYADHLGLAFQIRDDLLDIEGDAATLGKGAGKDAAAGKATFVSELGTAGARQAAEGETAAAIAALSPFGGRALMLRATAEFVIHRQS